MSKAPNEPPKQLKEEIRKRLLEVKKVLDDVQRKIYELNNKLNETRKLLEKGE